MRGEYTIKTKMLRRVFAMTALMIIAGVIGAIVVHASSGDEEEFSTVEEEDSTLRASEGQEQVRAIRLEEMKEERLLAEAEERRKKQEAEEQRLAEEKRKKQEAEERRLAEAKRKKEKEKEVKVASTSKQSTEGSGRNLGTFEATAYGPDCVGCSGITANGTDIRNGNIYVNGYRVIAADINVIPMNSIVRITYSSGKTEMAIVADVGGKIKGRIIDIAFASEAETPAFGRQQVQIELIK